MGLSRFELLTPRLSSVCSNQLSYRPVFRARPRLCDWRLLAFRLAFSPSTRPCLHDQLSKILGSPGSFKTRQSAHNQPVFVSDRSLTDLVAYGLQSTASGKNMSYRGPWAVNRGPRDHSRKEVIQPQVLLQLPCYDFTPITDHTLGTCLPCGLAGLLLVQPAFVM